MSDLGAPSVSKRGETTRMFESDFFEYFSRIHPATPFVTWLPVAVFLMWRSVGRHVPGLVAIALLFVLGVLAWTLLEYVLHRWLFHWERNTRAGRRIHFLLHGVHHDYPTDKDRLVMPLGVSIPLGIVIYALLYFLVGQAYGEPFYVGMVIGYLNYDGTHYAVHHFKQSTRVGRFLRKHHMLHHHADNDGGFGVSSPLWDIVFRTMPRPRRRTTTEA